MENFQYILPEIFISASIMLFLLVGVFKKNSASLIYNLSNISLVILLALIINLSSLDTVYLFNNSYLIDNLSNYMKIILVGSGIFVMLTGSKYIQVINLNKIEYPILILSSILGMMIMISSNDLIVFYMGLELQSLALYVLATYNRDQLKSSEAGLKYFVLSALSSGLLLYGCSLIYGFTGTTNFEILAKLLIDISNVDIGYLSFIEYNNKLILGIIFLTIGFTSIIELIHSLKSSKDNLKVYWLNINNNNIFIWMLFSLIFISGILLTTKCFRLVKEKWNDVIDEVKLGLIK